MDELDIYHDSEDLERGEEPEHYKLDREPSVETSMAWLVAIKSREHWIPKSCCHLNNEDGEWWLTIPYWLVCAKGL